MDRSPAVLRDQHQLLGFNWAILTLNMMVASSTPLGYDKKWVVSSAACCMRALSDQVRWWAGNKD